MDAGMVSLAEFPDEGRSVLQVHVDYLSLNRVEEFRAACLRLLQTGAKHMIVDLRVLIRVPSGVLAAVIDTGMLAASGMGSCGQVTVLASQGVIEQFRRFEHAGILRLQGPDGRPAPATAARARPQCEARG